MAEYWPQSCFCSLLTSISSGSLKLGQHLIILTIRLVKNVNISTGLGRSFVFLLPQHCKAHNYPISTGSLRMIERYFQFSTEV